MAVCLTPHLPRFIPAPTIHSTRVHRPLEHGYTITIARNNPRHHCRRQLLRIPNQAKGASFRAWQLLQHKDIVRLFAVCCSLDKGTRKSTHRACAHRPSATQATQPLKQTKCTRALRGQHTGLGDHQHSMVLVRRSTLMVRLGRGRGERLSDSLSTDICSV